jgi:hypothetical protein
VNDSDTHGTDAERPWYRDPPKLVAVVVGTIAIITSVTALVRSCAPSPPNVSVEYILDISRSMAGKIGHKEKLSAVAGEIVSNVEDTPNIATALRLSGGPTCSTGYKTPTVPFAEHNGDAIQRALQQVHPRGRSDFARAMTHAVNDLVGRNRAVRSEAKTVFIFVAGPDRCSGHRSLEIVKQALRDLRAERNIQVSFKFIGVKPPRTVKRLLRSAAREARRLNFSSDVTIANRPEDLARALPQPTPTETTSTTSS